MRPLIAIFAALMCACSATGQDFAKQRLEKSSRHQEWVDVKHGDRTVHCFLVFPEVKDKAPVIIVIHEIFGMTDWVKSVADQLAEAGYIAIAPDLLSGVEGKQDARRAVSTLPPDQVTADLNAVADYSKKKIDAANGKIAVCGFCWGGGQSFRFATNRNDLAAAFVFYGPSPRSGDIAKIRCPVYGFYAENDSRINAGIAKAEQAMKDAGKTYEPVTYEGAGHGFMRDGDNPKGREANKKARDAAWERWKKLLKKV